MTETPIIEVDQISKSFDTIDGTHQVLDDISLDVRPGEVLALLGKSGSGKSTLLRCIAGLMAPTSGAIRCNGQALIGPNESTAMVFQTFALLPWLDVAQNVELGLEARGVPRAERAEKAARAIKVIGLDGFEDAYPKELSGGMRQRVGFARAFVTEPQVLLMDEPFSALDVLTAENLRNELIDLIASDEFTIASVVIVTHNIEEAVVLADRIAVLGSNPGRIRALFDVDLPRPRDRNSSQFLSYVDQTYDLLTSKLGSSDSTDANTKPGKLVALPAVSGDSMEGLADILAREGTRTTAHLASDLGLDVDDLLPIVDGLELLGLAEVADGRVGLTKAGEQLVAAPMLEGKAQLRGAMLAHAPQVNAIYQSLLRASSHRLRLDFFRDTLLRKLPEQDADQQLQTAIAWGRYTDLYTFDADQGELRLNDEQRKDVGNTGPAAG